MHMHTMDQLLSRVVERKGFAVHGADREALLARKEDETLLAAWRTDGAVTQADVHAYLAAFEQVQATVGLLVAPRGIEPAAKDLAISRKGVDVWVESRLVVEVGEAMVRDACDATQAEHPAASVPQAAPAPAPAPARVPAKFPSLVAQAASAASTTGLAGIATFISNKPKGAPARAGGSTAEISQKNNVLGYAWGGGQSGSASSGIAQIRNGRRKPEMSATPVPSAPSTPAIAHDDVEIITTPKRSAPARAQAAPAIATPAPAPARSIIEPHDDYEIVGSKKANAPAASAPAPAAAVAAAPACSTLRLRVDKSAALAKLEAKQGAIVRLALVPHVAFTYDLHMERDGMPAPVTSNGAILVSSLTGELRAVDALDFAAAEPADARKDAEKLHAVDVYDKVKGHLAKSFSKTMNVEKEIAGNTVMANLKLVPDVNEMGLEHKGIVHVPVWEITGGGVNAKLDAYTGDKL